MAALLNLSKYSESKSIIVNNGDLGLVVGVLKNGIKMEARQHAVAILFYLSSVEEYLRLIGNNPDAIPLLVELIRVGDDLGKKNALVAIDGLLMLPSNHYRMLEGRLVSLLVTLLDSQESQDLMVDSLAVLSALAEKHDGAKSILRTRALFTIVKVLCSSKSDCSRFRGEHCISLLLSLCINGGREVIEVLVMRTSLMGALYCFLTDGTSRASKKANSIISILHEYSKRGSTPSMPHSLPHSNFIHVW
ncbi:U-box domain-containing protein 18-like [Silene latifolia]|uniref:U-box domain-containing protein 18-like n=1 Tax=Silene latifolia TaxID=37657 RepID=UPI003D78A6F0